METSENGTYKLMPSSDQATVLLTPNSSEKHEESSSELERILSDGDVALFRRLLPATWIELRLLFRLAAPTVICYMINYLMSMSTQVFAGHLGNLELAASSLGNNGIQTFAYGLLVMYSYSFSLFTSMQNIVKHINYKKIVSYDDGCR